MPQDKRDVVIDGVAFESSGRSLVRKDCESSVNAGARCGHTIVANVTENLLVIRFGVKGNIRLSFQPRHLWVTACDMSARAIVIVT